MIDFYCIYISSTVTEHSEIQQEKSSNNTDINYIKFILCYDNNYYMQTNWTAAVDLPTCTSYTSQ